MKTEYETSFEAGRKAQKEADQQEIDDLIEQKNNLMKQVLLEIGNTVEAKKQGMRKLVEYADDFCPHDEAIVSKKNCPKCWESKLKELGL